MKPLRLSLLLALAILDQVHPQRIQGRYYRPHQDSKCDRGTRCGGDVKEVAHHEDVDLKKERPPVLTRDDYPVRVGDKDGYEGGYVGPKVDGGVGSKLDQGGYQPKPVTDEDDYDVKPVGGGFDDKPTGPVGGGGYIDKPTGGGGYVDKPTGGRPVGGGGYIDKPTGGRPVGGGGYIDKPADDGGYIDKTTGGRPGGGGYIDKPTGGRPERPVGGGGYIDKPTDGGGYIDKPTDGGGYIDKPTGGRPGGGGYIDKPTGGRPDRPGVGGGGYIDKPTDGGGYIDKPTGGRPERPVGGGGYIDKPTGGRPVGGGGYIDKPTDGGGYIDKPTGGRPGGGGYIDKPTGGRPERPVGGGGYIDKPTGGRPERPVGGGGYIDKPTGGRPDRGGGGYIDRPTGGRPGRPIGGGGYIDKPRPGRPGLLKPGYDGDETYRRPDLGGYDDPKADDEDTYRKPRPDLGGYDDPQDDKFDDKPVPVVEGKCICVPYYQCKDGHIVTDGAGIIDARKRPDPEEELPLDGKFTPPSCGPYHVCCNTPETSTVKPYEHRCGVRNPSGINSRILSPSNKGEADFGEWPWQAAILKTEAEVNIFQCGGVLIDKYHVLTVAHCVFKFYHQTEYPLKVRLGEWDTQTTSEFLAHEDYRVSRIFVHTEFRNTSLWNDLAVLKLEQPVLFAPHIDTVCLPKVDEDFSGHNCIVTGWGKDAYNGGSFSNVMKEVALGVIDNYKCEEMLRKTRLGSFFELHEGFVCAGGEYGVDSCKGDGGGPLVCFRKDKSYALAGLVSWGIDCGQPGVPGVYVRIQKYIGWISKVTGLNANEYWSKQ